MVEGTVCPHPLYNYRRADGLFPNVFHEWIAWHHSIGFTRTHIYDLNGDFERPMKPWIDRGIVRYFPRFADPLYMRSSKPCCCNELMVLDHCLFVNQLTSRWVILQHSFDMFLYISPSFAANLSHAMERRLTRSKITTPARVAEVTVSSRPCGGTRAANESSIMLFDQCDHKSMGMQAFTTPILNPRNVQSQIVHHALIFSPNAAILRIYPKQMQTMHFHETRASRKMTGATTKVDGLRGRWPNIDAFVRSVIGPLYHQNRTMEGDIPKDMDHEHRLRFRKLRPVSATRTTTRVT
eukprot:NODE_3805_length_1160_cov_89.280617_g3519_i1.p1 GENE.NODE_3805_length_1160_cov_89.280617_g3519_i1~~NODE_3805_length_1160_cov_89.280617_g3519_i1.p1  ORF type:complete len:295 (+),score=10.34 NODE_3805_length_1160_cov_89.280617_g3519_i1:219-1103(+)